MHQYIISQKSMHLTKLFLYLVRLYMFLLLSQILTWSWTKGSHTIQANKPCSVVAVTSSESTLFWEHFTILSNINGVHESQNSWAFPSPAIKTAKPVQDTSNQESYKFLLSWVIIVKPETFCPGYGDAPPIMVDRP